MINDMKLIEKLNNTEILIDGANGLIGSCLCKLLDQLNTIYHSNIKIIALVRTEKKGDEIKGYINNPKLLEIVVGDILSPIDELKSNVDYVIHTASPTSGSYFLKKPVETLDIIINGTKRIMELAIKREAKSVVYLSSMEVYGQVDTETLLHENDLGYLDLTNMRNTYPLGKRAAEQLCLAMHEEYNLPVKIIRLAQTFGPGVSKNENRVYAQFLRSCIKGENIIMHTEGNSKRMYLDSEDAAEGILYGLLKGTDGEIYNLANEDTYCSIKEMAEIVVEHFGTKENKVIIEKTQDIGQYPPDNMLKMNTYKMQALGWEPHYNLVEMFQRMKRDLF